MDQLQIHCVADKLKISILVKCADWIDMEFLDHDFVYNQKRKTPDHRDNQMHFCLSISKIQDRSDREESSKVREPHLGIIVFLSCFDVIF